MRALQRILGSAVAAVVLMSLTSCGGGSDITGSGSGGGTTTPSGSNVATVMVDSGPNASGVNTLYTSVTICLPGSTTECQTIDNIQVDTGSYGLRVLASVVTLSLPIQKASDGNALGECTQFVDGYSWGPVAAADLTISGEAAASLPIQVIGDSSFTAVPDTCSSTGTEEDTVATFGANGILGIGVFEQDCGTGCATAAPAGYYYSCTTTACTPIAVPLTSQVLNPVSQFATDNNGTIIQLPSVVAAGAATVTGSLIFGIDTESNNASGSQAVLELDVNQGYFSTTFEGATMSQSFIDSGSNGLYFNVPSGGTPITACTQTGFSGFYCPTSTLSLSAQLTGTNAASTTVTFSVGDAQTFSATDTALPTLGGAYPGSTDGFDFGLNFFYGRSIYNAIENHTSKVGTGPYVAF